MSARVIGLVSILSLHASVAFAAVPGITVKGGTPAQQQRIRDAFNKVPECLRSCDGKPMEVEILADEDPNAGYDWSERKMTFNSGILPPGATEAIVKAEKYACMKPGAMSWYENTDRVMLHELAHYFHMTCDAAAPGAGKNQAQIVPFTDLELKAKMKKWNESTERQAIIDQLNPTLDKTFDLEGKIESLTKEIADLEKGKLEKPGPGTIGSAAMILARAEKEIAGKKKLIEAAKVEMEKLKPEFQKTVCDFQNRMQKVYDGLGLPKRNEFDRHAVDDTRGAEYFAMAVEMLQYDPAGFCKFYSPTETTWLKQKLGACLDQLPKKADCYRDSSRSPTKGVIGGEFLRR